MKKLRITLSFVLALFFCADLFSSSEGKKSPALIMKASNGAVFNPGKNGKTKPVILSFFSHNCLPCMNEIPELQAIAGSSCDIYLVADTATGDNEAADFFRRIRKSSGREITIPVVYDIYGDMMKQFKVRSYPVLLFIDRDGIIRLRFEGYKSENIEVLKKRINYKD